MLILLRSVPPAPDQRIVLACIRACIWANIEGWPFCLWAPAGVATAAPGTPH